MKNLINSRKDVEKKEKNEDLIKILGVVSLFVPILNLVVLYKTRKYNKKNNFRGSEDIDIGKTCAEISLATQATGIAVYSVLINAFLYNFAI